jgi:hypothetical protein
VLIIKIAAYFHSIQLPPIKEDDKCQNVSFPTCLFLLTLFSSLHLLKATIWSSWSLIKKCNKCLLRSITKLKLFLLLWQKSYPFANVKRNCHLIWKTFCHLDRAASIKTALQTYKLQTSLLKNGKTFSHLQMVKYVLPFQILP